MATAIILAVHVYSVCGGRGDRKALCLLFNELGLCIGFLWSLSLFIQGGPKKLGLYFGSDNMARTNDRKACIMSKVSEFCLELNA